LEEHAASIFKAERRRVRNLMVEKTKMEDQSREDWPAFLA
jgi:hypothetical protein